MSDFVFVPIPLKTEQKRYFLKRYLLLIFLGLLVTAFFGDIGSFYFLFYGMCGLFLVTWLWLRSNLQDFTVARIFDPRAFYGQKVKVRLEFHNQGRWPILWLGILEHLPWQIALPQSYFQAVASFLPGERIAYDYTLNCEHRGYYNLGPMNFQCGDFWGILTPRTYSIPAQPLIVYPRIVSLVGLTLFSQSPLGNLKSAHPLLQDPNAPIGVRPYLTGDSLKQIDWKTTACSGNLQVKFYQPSKSMDAYIVLNLDKKLLHVKGWESTIERGVTIAASLASWLHEQRQSFGISTFGYDPLLEKTGQQSLELSKGHVHLIQVLELLARIREARIIAFQEPLQKICSNLPWGTLLLMVIPQVEEDFFYDLLSFRRKGLYPVLMLTNPKDKFARIKAQGKELNVPCFRMENEVDLEIWKGMQK